MTRTFQTHNKRRFSMILWTLVFMLIAVAQLLSRQPPFSAILFFLIACMGGVYRLAPSHRTAVHPDR